MDEGKLRQQRAKGEHAKRVLEDEPLKDALAKIDADLVDLIRNSAIDDDATRRNARIALGILEKLPDLIRQTMTTGEFAAKELLRIEQESKIRRLVHGRR